MPRMARVVIPGVPHHIVQRGARKLDVFFGTEDYKMYLRLLSTFARKADTQIWAYCLMPNHVHLILVPSEKDGLRKTLGEAHRIYSREINKREEWQGHLWQERFYSYPMSDDHLLNAVKYIECNPVAAKLVKHASEWPWSSASAHLNRRSDGIVNVTRFAKEMKSWGAILDEPVDEVLARDMDRHISTGRPQGSDGFIKALEDQVGRRLTPQKRGRKPLISREE
jgi:REP-associated tyrosine transposase